MAEANKLDYAGCSPHSLQDQGSYLTLDETMSEYEDDAFKTTDEKEHLVQNQHSEDKQVSEVRVEEEKFQELLDRKEKVFSPQILTRKEMKHN